MAIKPVRSLRPFSSLLCARPLASLADGTAFHSPHKCLPCQWTVSLVTTGERDARPASDPDPAYITHLLYLYGISPPQ